MKKIFSLILTLMLLIQAFPISVFAGDFDGSLYLEYDGGVYKYKSRVVTIAVDGSEVTTGDMPAVILDGRTLVPVREVFESKALGAKVDWNGDKKEIYVTYGDTFIVLTIDSKVAMVNGEPKELDVPAKLIRDLSKNYAKTMIPLRFVSELMSFKVDWDNDSYTAILSRDKVTPPVVEEGQTPLPSVDDPAETGEKLDSLTGEGAKRPLPTPLKNAPIHWQATVEQLEEINESYVETSITSELHEETTINKVRYDDTGVFKQFIIESAGAMSGVNYFIWNNKFIMDVSNSVNKLQPETTFENNPILTGIRSSQYSVAPNATRIVFDLKEGGNKFELSFSEDRSKLYVKVMDNSIKDIVLGQNTTGDYIQVTGVAAPDAKMFRLSNPDRIVIDFPNTKSVLGYNEAIAQGQYVTKIRTAQFDATTTRVVVETDGQADYEITKAAGGQTVIQFMEPGYSNIIYDNTESPTISLEEDEVDIKVDGVVYDNDYINKISTITLSENYGALFGDGSLKVNDGIIETVDVRTTEAGLTQLVIKTTKVYEFRLEEADGKIDIKAYRPKELYKKIIVVDTGHGGKDPGAMANGLYEKEVNLKITLQLKALLDADPNIKVYYTRLTDIYPTLQERCDLANEIEADLFLSIHNNAYNPSETGTETLYFPSTEVGKLTSPVLATIMQKQIVAMTGAKDRGIKQRENLFVLKHTAMPAVIVEIGFLTNTNDAAKLKEEAYLKQVALALYQGVNEVFNTYPTKR